MYGLRSGVEGKKAVKPPILAGRLQRLVIFCEKLSQKLTGSLRWKRKVEREKMLNRMNRRYNKKYTQKDVWGDEI